MNNSHLTDQRFDQFDLSPNVIEGLHQAGFELCTDIQAMTLPEALQGKDIAGQAQTGTGKTAAFLVAVFNALTTKPKRSDKQKEIRTLILAPTRELAIQIHKDAVTLGGGKYLKLGLAYGGVDYEKQRNLLEKGVDILIGTPGRVIDYQKQGVFSLANTELVVLDEADRMFDLGFIADIRYLLRRCPAPELRQSLLFSATLSQRVLELAYEHMNDPVNIAQESDTITAKNIKEQLYLPALDEKLPLLAALLRQTPDSRSMVFINTKHIADKVQRTLEANGFKAEVLSGDVKLPLPFQQGVFPEKLIRVGRRGAGFRCPLLPMVLRNCLPSQQVRRADILGDAKDFLLHVPRQLALVTCIAQGNGSLIRLGNL